MKSKQVVLIPKVVVVPTAFATNAMYFPSSPSSKSIDSVNDLDSVQHLENDRRCGQDMLRQLVYGDIKKTDNVDISQVDWKAVIELADTLHKREQRLLKRLGKKRSRSRHGRITTRSQSRDTDATVSTPSSPESLVHHRRNNTASTSAMLMEESMQHENQQLCDSIPTQKKKFKGRLWSFFLSRWKQCSKTKSQKQNQTVINTQGDPSSFSINLISCPPETTRPTNDGESFFHNQGQVHGSSKTTWNSAATTAPSTFNPTPKIQIQRHSQQVVAVGCHVGFFSSFRRSDLKVDATGTDHVVPQEMMRPCSTVGTHSPSSYPSADTHHKCSISFTNLEEELCKLEETLYE